VPTIVIRWPPAVQVTAAHWCQLPRFGSRWPGCKTEASWCDAHHCRYWKAHEGPTCITNLILLCRYHHVLVHEGKWQLGFDPTTGEVTITRPDGRPYELPPSTPWTRACTRANDPWPDG
jgi:hypothetical protein